MRQPLHRGLAVRPPVYQVSHREQAVAPRIEAAFVQRLLEAGEMAMDIAHGEVASGGVARQAQESGVLQVRGHRKPGPDPWKKAVRSL
nr:hypothetical protein [Bordetella pertussis]